MTPATRRWLWLGGWLLAAALIWLLARGIDYATLSGALRQSNWTFLLVAMVAFALIQPVGAMQWHAVLPRGCHISRSRMLTLYSLTSLANNTAPSIVGHATGAALLAAEPGIGGGAALSVIALDQLAVGLSKLVVLSTVALLFANPDWIVTGLAVLSTLVMALAGGLVLASRQSARLQSASDAAASRRYVGRALSLAARWAARLDAVHDPRRLATAVAWALTARLLEYVAIAAVAFAMGAVGHTLLSPLFVLAATSLATVVPFAPAGLGTYEAGVYGAYRFLGAQPEVALAIAVVQHACVLVPAVGIGYVTLTVRRRV